MKSFKVLLAGWLALAATLVYAAPDCSQPDQFVVKSTTFSRVPLGQAISKILAETPYTSQIIGPTDVRVTAEGVSGPLSSVLSSLSDYAKFSMEIKGCQIVITPDGNEELAAAESSKAKALAAIAAVESVPRWEIQLSDRFVSSALKRWGNSANWRVVWDAPKEAEIVAGATYNGTFEEAVEQVVKSLAPTDSPVAARFYPNHVVRIIRFDGQTSDLNR